MHCLMNIEHCMRGCGKFQYLITGELVGDILGDAEGDRLGDGKGDTLGDVLIPGVKGLRKDFFFAIFLIITCKINNILINCTHSDNVLKTNYSLCN